MFSLDLSFLKDTENSGHFAWVQPELEVFNT